MFVNRLKMIFFVLDYYNYVDYQINYSVDRSLNRVVVSEVLTKLGRRETVYTRGVRKVMCIDALFIN